MPDTPTPASPSLADPFALPDWRQAKIESPALFAAIAAVLFRHDPIGINFGGNPDEYEPEAGTILPRLADCHTEADVCRVVHEEFLRWFCTVGDRAEYVPLAREIWALLQKPVRRSQLSRTSAELIKKCGRRGAPSLPMHAAEPQTLN